MLLLSCFVLISIPALSSADWNCVSSKSGLCFQRIQQPLTWSQAHSYCAGLGGQLPGAEHLNEIIKNREVGQPPFWTSLCFDKGRLQWLSETPREEKDLAFIDLLLDDLTSVEHQSEYQHCFYVSGDQRHKGSGLTIEYSEQVLGALCVSEEKSAPHKQLAGPRSQGKILSAEVVSLGADIDWGPVGKDRQGFMNIFPLKFSTLRLKCDVKTTDPDLPVEIRWRRNGGYMGNNSQEIGFASQEALVQWTGTITCEAVVPGQEEVILGPGFHLVVWNTVTVRIINACTSCSVQNMVEEAKFILTQFVEKEIEAGHSETMQFFVQAPVILKSHLSVTMHIRNLKIDKFDFKMAQKLGPGLFQLSRWAQERSLLKNSNKSPELTLDLISPCNNALPEDRYTNNSWIGYPGQVVPSNNFIGGPICLDENGDMITRSCGLNIPNQFKECSRMKERREEPKCMHGFQLSADGRCSRITDSLPFDEAVSQCWAGSSLHEQMIKTDVGDWIQNSVDVLARTRSLNYVSKVWLPASKLNRGSSLQAPIWNWNGVSNKWIPNAGSSLKVRSDGYADEECAAYDVKTGQVTSQPCKTPLPMVCGQPTLPANISTLVFNLPDQVGEYFCPPGWITHVLAMDSNLCYKRFTMPEAVTWDEAREECIRQGGDLSMAPTHSLRIAMEMVYMFFNNQSIVDSWIGARNPGGKPGVLRWANETVDTPPSETYVWQPYNEFGVGYGASTGLTRMWWNWPKDTKIWGLLCQKGVSSDWQDDLKLHLEPTSDRSSYDLIFSYNPKKNPSDEKVKEIFWESEMDVVCHLAGHVQHMKIQIVRHQRQAARVSLSVPATLGAGPLTCEAWLNKPAYRFHSNTVQHGRPSGGGSNNNRGYITPAQDKATSGGRTPLLNLATELAAGIQQAWGARNAAPERGPLKNNPRPLVGLTMRY